MTVSQDTDIIHDGNEVFAATVTVLDDFGLHARPAANLAKIAQNFESEISIGTKEQKADAKSILDLLSLAAARDTELKITCRGKDAQGAGEALVRLFESRFNLPGEH